MNLWNQYHSALVRLVLVHESGPCQHLVENWHSHQAPFLRNPSEEFIAERVLVPLLSNGFDVRYLILRTEAMLYSAGQSSVC